MQNFTVDQIVTILQQKSILHDLLIDRLYMLQGLAALEDLELNLTGNIQFEGKETVLLYLENKIAKAKHEQDLQFKKLELDVENLTLTKEYIELQKREIANAPKQRTWNLIITSSVAILAASLSAWLTYKVQPKQPDVVLNPTVLPNVQIVRDTVYIKSASTAVKTSTNGK